MADTEYIKGLDQLQKFMDELPVKLEVNIMRGAMRAGMSVVKPVAQHNIHSVSGELARGLKISTRLRGDVVTASLRAGGIHRSVGILVEYGTKAHLIRAVTKSALALAGIFRKIVHHPGAKAKPFMRPALDMTASAATVAVGEYVKERLTKEGLNTSHIMVEGDQ